MWHGQHLVNQLVSLLPATPFSVLHRNPGGRLTHSAPPPPVYSSPHITNGLLPRNPDGSWPSSWTGVANMANPTLAFPLWQFPLSFLAIPSLVGSWIVAYCWFMASSWKHDITLLDQSHPRTVVVTCTLLFSLKRHLVCRRLDH